MTENDTSTAARSASSDEATDRDSGSMLPSNDDVPVDHDSEGFIERDELARVVTAVSDFSRGRISRTLSLSTRNLLPEVSIHDPRLNPSNDAFEFILWAQKFMSLLEQEGHQLQRSGFTFKDLHVTGHGSTLKWQETVFSSLMAPFRRERFKRPAEKVILKNLNGSVQSGEMLIVLGRPGAGCTTFLKSVCGELQDISLFGEVKYDGVTQKDFLKEFKGEVAYNQETEEHFPHLTVGETLEFAAACRTPHRRIMNVSRQVAIQHKVAVVLRIFGLTHTKNTKVGNDFIRGVSGGERKRVSISEMALAGSPICAWDNSSRGLDSATALEFIQSLRTFSNVTRATQAVAIYQASQSIYDLFDKALVLYEGRQIYFGPAEGAVAYFERMGYQKPPRQTSGDFLTAVTSPNERKARAGFEHRVPRTPDEFEAYWQQSDEFGATQKLIAGTDVEFGKGEQSLDAFRKSHRERQARHTRPESPYIISIPMQIQLCMKRAYQRIWNDKTSTISIIGGQIIQALIVGSIYYGGTDTTASFFAKGAVAFFAMLLSALQSINEINSLYDQIPIVVKHNSFAFYHPWTEAAAGIVADLPIKFFGSSCFLIIIYFMAGLKAEAAAFFTFFLFCFLSTLTMSAIFRTTAAATKNISQALAIGGILVLWIAVYTGFTIQRSYMHPWFKWLSWINPIAYGFESLLVNEVHGRHFPCASTSLVPPYGQNGHFACAIAGAVQGENVVSGDNWVESAYGYSYSHIWRNLGFIFAFWIFFLFTYLLASEFNSRGGSSADVLVYQRGAKLPAMQDVDGANDEEKVATRGPSTTEPRDEKSMTAIPAQKDVFSWENVTLDIKIKGEPRRLLDNVSGWVKPGTLTALMGTSGAGKTTLLDALSQRISVGILTGDMLVNGRALDASFQRKTGYVQQQDLHLETTTVREALQFSALLRQPDSVSRREKLDYAEKVIGLLGMQNFADAIVGVPGSGLNVEQRKLLTIGVELAAKPALLLFLDEPTSGLDSQSSWSIVTFLRKLADNGQAVLCTIHQPSALLFQQFDRLLFLARGGKTVYFGDVGDQSRAVLDYFEQHGGPHCPNDDNPAEYILRVVGKNDQRDWHETWKASSNFEDVQRELERLHALKTGENTATSESHSEFAMPLLSQVSYVTHRVFQQYWRTPSYIQNKYLLVILSALFIGFTFYKQNSTQTGLQNLIFGVFMLAATFATITQQIMPRFVIQRSLYEVRERPSKAYSWSAFIFANVIVEIPYQVLLGILAWAAWYYPILGTHNSSEQSGLMLLYIIEFMLLASTFAHLVIAALPDSKTAGTVSTLLFSMTLTFCGVLQSPDALPGFWIFMYRVSPLTYLVGGEAAIAIAKRTVRCADNELAVFDPPSGQTCGQYLAKYLTTAAGQLYNENATSGCEYCPLRSGAQYLAGQRISYDQRWRNFGILWAFIIFNIFGAVSLYYLFRVRRVSLLRLIKRS